MFVSGRRRGDQLVDRKGCRLGWIFPSIDTMGWGPVLVLYEFKIVSHEAIQMMVCPDTFCLAILASRAQFHINPTKTSFIGRG